ncbi:hypothetical protein E2C01_003432 [Portunus trituberculatus]|uniref:Uncharacterized protein n=1 Tax=Portunus trituberculatus TaxID=210409 RepID=A0A5B7CM73_PORTR|nr:hypothetical protein [Portunus trituberculatus]
MLNGGDANNECACVIHLQLSTDHPASRFPTERTQRPEFILTNHRSAAYDVSNGPVTVRGYPVMIR